MNCNTTHYRANSSSVPGDPTPRLGTCALATVDPSGPQRTAYQGVPVDGGQPATAIVYVTMAYDNASDPRAIVNVTLRARLNGKLLGGNQVTQIRNPPHQQDATGITKQERETIGVKMRIPDAWLQAAGATDDRFDLEAFVKLDPGPDRLIQCAVSLLGPTGCAENDTYRLDNVGVWTDLARLYISPLALLVKGQNRDMFQAPADRTSRMRAVLPGGRQMTIGPWRGEVDITGATEVTARAEVCEDAKLPVRECRMQLVELRVQDHLAKERNAPPFDLILGLHRYPSGNGTTEPGWQVALAPLGHPFARLEINEGSDNRPLMVATHEFMHAMGIMHADTAAPEPLTGRRCGGAGGGFGEPWPPDNYGYLQGAAFGRFDEAGNRTDVVEVEERTKEGILFDLMSYCGRESDAWISPFNWTRVFDRLRNYTSRVGPRAVARGVGATGSPRARATVTGRGYVLGIVTPGGVVIDRVVPADPDNEIPAPDPSSPVKITALGASGRPVGEVGASVAPVVDADVPSSTFIAPLPAGAAAVTAASGANTDRVERSKPPTLKLLAPRAGTRVGGSRKARLDVRWTARDPDGDTLEVTVDYAADGRTFVPVYSGPDRGRAAIAGDLLSASRAGRVRVSVSDGFSRARATSGPIVAEGSPPEVSITSPAGRDDLTAGVPALLTGGAVDDAGRRLTGRSLTWFAGAKRLGTGDVLRAPLPAGGVRLRLVARDRAGRIATVARTVRVAAAPLTLDRLDAPVRVKPRVKTIAVTAQTSTAATLTIGGRRYAVGTKAKRLTVTLPARPATGALKLGYTIAAKGRRTVRGSVAVVRV